MRVERKFTLGFHPSSLRPRPLLRLFVSGVFAAASAKLAELESLRRRLLVLSSRIIPTLTIRAL
jgi:hypothetical protein